MAAAAGDEDRAKRRSQSAFLGTVVDLSTLWESEDAIAMAHDLTGVVGSYELYEKVGTALLSAARLARFDEDPERAGRHLAAASHVFDLADQKAKAERAETSKMGLIHMSATTRSSRGGSFTVPTRSQDKAGGHADRGRRAKAPPAGTAFIIPPQAVFLGRFGPPW